MFSFPLFEREKAERELTDKDHHIKETETSLKFGAFLLALSYFKAMTHVAREKASWAGKDDRMDSVHVRSAQRVCVCCGWWWGGSSQAMVRSVGKRPQKSIHHTSLRRPLPFTHTC